MAKYINNYIIFLLIPFGTGVWGPAHGFESPISYIQKPGLQQTQSDTIPPSKALAPGTIKLEGEVIQIHPEKSGDGINFKLKVTHILGIGASVPPIAEKDTVEIASVKKPKMLSPGQSLTCLIQHRKVLAGTNAPDWELSKIFESKDH